MATLKSGNKSVKQAEARRSRV